MAALGNLTAVRAKSGQANLAVSANNTFTMTYSATFAGSLTAATVDLTGFVVPKGTLVLAAAFKCSTAQGSATYQVGLTTDGTLGTKAANDAVNTWVINGTPTPKIATADRTVQITLADAATVAGTITVSLVCVNFEQMSSGYTPVGV
jgi:hypothetical protein